MKYILFALPVIIMLEMIAWSVVCSLLSEPNDMAVIAGVSLICVLVYIHFITIKYLLSKFKL